MGLVFGADVSSNPVTGVGFGYGNNSGNSGGNGSTA